MAEAISNTDETGLSAEANMPPHATCAPGLRSRIYALSHDLTMLVGMIEGAAVMYDSVEPNFADNPVARRAANAMSPMLESITAEADRINGALDEIEMRGFGK